MGGEGGVKMVVFQCKNSECLCTFTVEKESSELDIYCPTCTDDFIEKVGETEVIWEGKAE